MTDEVNGVPPRGFVRVRVSGGSMVPALRHGDLLLARAQRSPAAYDVGDVVVAHFATRPGIVIIKRVAQRRADGLWVRGDNPEASDASDEYGVATPLAKVIGRLWPRPGRIASMREPT